MSLRKALLTVLAMLGFGLSTASHALVFDLNCSFSTPDNCTVQATSYGTITITNLAPGTVSVVVDLSGIGSTVQEVDLNFNPTFTNTGWISTFPGGVLASEDSIHADGYSGRFDLALPANGSCGTASCPEPVAFTITHTGGLSASDFNFTDTNNLLFAAVHIGACVSGTIGCPVGQSIWVGATGGGGGQTQVSEPSMLALVGLGLVMVGFL